MSPRRSGPSLAERAEALQEAIRLGAGRLPQTALAPARAIVERAAQRAALSGEHTVVALAGATGAGKSSVFNAIAGSEITRTGVQRPTTSNALAVVVGGGGGDVLDWLSIHERHRLEPNNRLADGLILLDLPDHDSVVADHRIRADYLTERADLLIWVTNPQKYADAILHDRYLRPLAGHNAVVLLVLNQIDRLSPAEAQSCVADLRSLAAKDGLTDVTVLGVSAHTGAGMDQLRSVIADAVRRREAATARLIADVRHSARDLLDATVPSSDVPSGKVREAAAKAQSQLIDALETAAGIPLVVDAVRGSSERDAIAATGWPPTRWVNKLRADPLRRIGLRGLGMSGKRHSEAQAELVRTSLPSASPAARSAVAGAARRYVSVATAELPEPWGEQARAMAVVRARDLSDDLDVAIAGTAIEASRVPIWQQLVGFLQWALIALVVVGFTWLAILFGFAYLQMPEPPTPMLGQFPLPTVLLAGGVFAGLVLALLSRLLAILGASRRASAARTRLRESVERVAREKLTAPIEAETAALHTIRERAEVAASETKGRLSLV
ncbi:GTPase family protein [Millisia brevis]|uniref:GTPase family protein n=1 Tax=Millisia brevis TaxID=264148 RepID=UPI00083360F6|nr:GTPase [Millisia brevis]